MNKNILIFILSVLLVLSSSFLVYKSLNNEGRYYKPELSVIGDVNNIFKMDSYQGLTTVNINHKGSNIEVVRLEEIINKSLPSADDYNILLSATDGLQALIPGKRLDKCYINFSSANGWEAINLNHPVSSNVKFIKNIIIISRKEDIKNSFSIITHNENLIYKTVGQLLGGEYCLYPHFEGSASIENDGKIYKDSLYTVKKIIEIEDLLDIKINSGSFLIGEQGITELYRGGILVLKDNRIDYVDHERKVRVKDCKGMLINPPVRRISDTYHDTLHYKENGQKVLILLLDGFGFHQYRYALNNGYAPFLAGYKSAEKAVSVYKPVTNAGLAATLTGKGPEENGVYSRKQKELQTVDIFKQLSKSGVESLYIEGNIKILNTDIEPLLNPDLNKNGSTDDEVFNAVLDNLHNSYKLIYVHFHGIDDCGHNHGDLNVKTMEKIKEIDLYVQQLIEEWPGKVIITADHGMHKTVNGGDHGMLRYEDLIVPYILAEGGRVNE